MSEKKHSLLEQFIRIQWLLSWYHHKNKVHGPMGNLHQEQGRILKLLKEYPDLTERDISDVLDMGPHSLNDSLTKLERDGYITRTSLGVKWIIVVSLTDKGMNAANQDEQLTGFEELFSCISDEEKANLSEYLNRIIGELEKELAEGQD